jgi:imidazolonepropionase-like amidohydrolase
MTLARTLIENATVIDPASGHHESSTIVVEGGALSLIADHVPRRPEDVAIDATGLFLLPGLCDAHCHLMYDNVSDPVSIELTRSVSEATVAAVANANTLLAKGFTTVRDVGSRGSIGVALRNAINDGRIPGPRVFCAGRILSTPGGLLDLQPSHVFEDQPYRYGLGELIIGPHQARAAVRRQVKDGVDWIKVGVSGTGFNPLCPAERAAISPEELTAIVDEAQVQSVPVAAHAESLWSVKQAARSGVATIEHAIYLDDDAVDMILTRDIAVTPTLAMYTAFVERGHEYGIPQNIVELHKSTHDTHVESIRKAYAAGVRILAGGDAGLTHFPQGSCREEAVQLVELVGMSPMEAIQALTSNIAETLGQSNAIGSIAEGGKADLVAFRNDPSQDIRVLTHDEDIAFVMKGGQLVHGAPVERWPN